MIIYDKDTEDMVTSIYGRQWNDPSPEYAFKDDLLKADEACIRGDKRAALTLYKKIADTNPIAKRRLNIAARQSKRLMDNKGNENRKNTLNIAFIDWYNGYETDIQIFLLFLFKEANINVEITEIGLADLVIAGCYGAQLLHNKDITEDKLVMFVAGENISPSYNHHDCSMTPRNHNYLNKNIRLPQWFCDIEFAKCGIRFREVNNKLPRMRAERDMLVSAIYNNSTPERESILYLLRKEFGENNIHVFGSQRGRSVDKLQILSRSVINMCFENSIGDGYVTEKLLHSKVMGCQSLYWGDDSYELDFTNTSVHNVKSAKSLSETIDWCKRMIKQSRPYNFEGTEIGSNIFQKEPSIASIVLFLKRWSAMMLCWRR